VTLCCLLERSNVSFKEHDVSICCVMIFFLVNVFLFLYYFVLSHDGNDTIMYKVFSDVGYPVDIKFCLSLASSDVTSVIAKLPSQNSHEMKLHYRKVADRPRCLH
jgi:hypothetical protein